MSKYFTSSPNSVNTVNAHTHDVVIPKSNRNFFIYDFDQVAQYVSQAHSIELPEDFREQLKEAHKTRSYSDKRFAITSKTLDGIVDSSKLWVQTGNVLPMHLNKLVLHQICTYAQIDCSVLATAKPEWFGKVPIVRPFAKKFETVLRENGTFFIYE